MIQTNNLRLDNSNIIQQPQVISSGKQVKLEVTKQFSNNKATREQITEQSKVVPIKKQDHLVSRKDQILNCTEVTKELSKNNNTTQEHIIEFIKEVPNKLNKSTQEQVTELSQVVQSKKQDNSVPCNGQIFNYTEDKEFSKKNNTTQELIIRETLINNHNTSKHDFFESIHKFENVQKKNEINFSQLVQQLSHTQEIINETMSLENGDQTLMTLPQEKVDVYDYDSDCTEFELPFQSENQLSSETETQNQPKTVQTLLTNEMNEQEEIEKIDNGKDFNILGNVKEDIEGFFSPTIEVLREISNQDINFTTNENKASTTEVEYPKSPFLLKKSNERFHEINKLLTQSPESRHKIKLNIIESPFKKPLSPDIAKKVIEIKEPKTMMKKNVVSSFSNIQKDITLQETKSTTHEAKTLHEFNTNLRKELHEFSQNKANGSINFNQPTNITDPVLHKLTTLNVKKEIQSIEVKAGTTLENTADKGGIESFTKNSMESKLDVNSNHVVNENYPSRNTVNVYQTLTHISELMKDRARNPFIAKINTMNTSTKSAQNAIKLEIQTNYQQSLEATANFSQKERVLYIEKSADVIPLSSQHTLSGSQIKMFLSNSQIEDNNAAISSGGKEKDQLRLEGIMNIRGIGKSICFTPEPGKAYTAEWISDDLKLFY